LVLDSKPNLAGKTKNPCLCQHQAEGWMYRLEFWQFTEDSVD
jgi:hypothetical protein